MNKEELDKFVDRYLDNIKDGWYQDMGFQDPEERGLIIYTDEIIKSFKRHLYNIMTTGKPTNN